MARFMVIHSTPPEGTQEELIEGAKKVAASMAPGAQWLNSWAVPATDQLFCEWEAPNTDLIRASIDAIEDLFPVETIYEVEWIDPEWYK